MRCSLWTMPVLVLAGCSAGSCESEIYAVPVSGRIVPALVAPSTLSPPVVSWSVPPRRSTSTSSTTTTSSPPATSTSTTTTTVAASTIPPTTAPPPTLEELVADYFEPDDHAWALRVAFCESSATGRETYSSAINRSSGSAGWFQHLPKFWDERSVDAGFAGADLLDPEANVGVAAWLLYSTPGGKQHWYPSESCWR